VATVLLCSEPFIATAAREAVAAGMPDLSRVLVPLDLGRRAVPAGHAGGKEVVAAAISALTSVTADDVGRAVVNEPAGEELDVLDSLEAITALFEERRWTDGLPIVPPTAERVAAMVAGSGRRGEELVAVLPPGHGAATIRRLAVNTVMAGCRPDLMPVVVAAIEAMADPVFNLNAIQGSTNPVAPLTIVSGPARTRLGFNSGYGCFGPGWRANATVGRALRLALINIGGGVPGEKDMAVAGHPGKYTFCVAENEEESPWEPLHVERGFAAGASAVTVVGISSFINSLRAGPEYLAEAVAFTGSNDYRFGGCPLFALNPLHAAGLARAGWRKPELKGRIWELSRKRVREFERRDLLREDLESLDNKDAWVPVARRPEDLLVIVAGAGGAGGHSLIMPSFGTTRPVTREIAAP
jgi:hypothetical protein